jgi:hypothetical protein
LDCTTDAGFAINPRAVEITFEAKDEPIALPIGAQGAADKAAIDVKFARSVRAVGRRSQITTVSIPLTSA